MSRVSPLTKVLHKDTVLCMKSPKLLNGAPSRESLCKCLENRQSVTGSISSLCRIFIIHRTLTVMVFMLIEFVLPQIFIKATSGSLRYMKHSYNSRILRPAVKCNRKEIWHLIWHLYNAGLTSHSLHGSCLLKRHIAFQALPKCL